MERYRGRVALITGVTSGIGRAAAKALIERGVKVCGCGRRQDRINSLIETYDKSGLFFGLVVDITNENEVVSMYEKIREKWGGVDILINNAGLAKKSPLSESPTSYWTEQINTNVVALSTCTREAIKSLESRKVDDGYIINISSIAGHRVPNNVSSGSIPMGMYAATKHAVKALTESLRQELRIKKSGTRVSMLSPGQTETEFWDVAFGNDYGKNTKTFDRLEAEDIADMIVFFLSTHPRVEIHDIIVRPTHQPL